MILGLDMDDTITRTPAFFSMLSKSVKGIGGSVHIVSHRPSDEKSLGFTKEQLRGFDVPYDGIFHFPPLDAVMDLCPHEDLEDHEKYMWLKVDYCLKNGVEVFFDDDEMVVDLFTRFAPAIQVFRVCGAGDSIL